MQLINYFKPNEFLMLKIEYFKGFIIYIMATISSNSKLVILSLINSMKKSVLSFISIIETFFKNFSYKF